VGKRKSWDSGLETIIRHWPHLPDHAQRTLVEMVIHYGPETGRNRFPTPPGSEWTDVEIVLLHTNEVRIAIKGVTQTYTMAGLGLADGRNRKRPREEWQMLVTYAENPEPDAYYKLPKRENLKVHIFRFRKWLQSFFGIPGDPLKPFRSGLWLPRFKIRVE
jgi:hypothetical protein